MFTSFIGWVKGLSVAGKVALGVIGMTAAGAMAAPSSVPPSTTSNSQVKAEQDAKVPEITTETVVETEAIPFAKQVVETADLDKGVAQVTTVGVTGTKTITYKVTKSNGTQISKEEVGSEVTISPVDEVTSVGTYVAPLVPRNNCDPNYSPCVPLVSYDLDCPDIGFSVRVVGSDPHRFDREGDGYGCEAY